MLLVSMDVGLCPWLFLRTKLQSLVSFMLVDQVAMQAILGTGLALHWKSLVLAFTLGQVLVNYPANKHRYKTGGYPLQLFTQLYGITNKQIIKENRLLVPPAAQLLCSPVCGRFGLVVSRWSRSTKLLYASSG